MLANNLDKPINLTNGPKGITPISRPPIFFAPALRAIGIDPDPNVIYPLYLYAPESGSYELLVNRDLGVPLKTYVVATFFGIIPATFAFAAASPRR